MIWNDLLVNRNLSKDEIATTISQVFSVSPIDVLVIDDIAEPNVGKNIRIVCEDLPVRGDFLMRLSIYLHDSKLEQLSPKSTVKRFCGILHCKCLRSDSSINPYSMLLVRESEYIQPVALDPERLAQNEEYIIIELEEYESQ